MGVHGIIYPSEKEDETKIGSGRADYCGNIFYGVGNRRDICAVATYDPLSATCCCMLREKLTKVL